ncbi:MAG TPA: DUF3857 domain-containing protein [Dongiaceae bacterium]|nr:DUF3857 domain-containing protein [Dongiaceae bacterium]
MRKIWLIIALFLSNSLSNALAFGADWPSISDSDRSFNSIPQQPGAPAVILTREETDDNMNNSQIVYERIKILSEAGRKYATVFLPYGRSISVSELKGRTVHADGTVTPFSGKAVETTREGPDGIPVTVKAFTLPDPEVGSILDFRYTLQYMDNRVFPPEWEVQTDLFQRNAYFKFVPMQNRGYASVLLDHDQLARNLAWTPLLGNGAKPEMHTLPSKTNATVHDVLLWVDLKMQDIPALIEEPFRPSAALLRWRVYFYYQSTLKPEEYWKKEKKFWEKDLDTFLEKNDGVDAAVSKLVSPSDAPEVKVQKIYSFVAGLKNESRDPTLTKQKPYALEYRSPECIMESGIVGIAAIGGPSHCVHTESSPVEQKKQTRGVKDVLQEGGTHDELNRLFVAMVRAAGIPASMLWVTDRSQQAFLKEFLSTDQLDAEIAVVQFDGKDLFLDPGTKLCPYGMIDWRYSAAMGLRQNTSGVEFGQTPPLDYKQSLITRKADLVLDPSGVLAGTVSLVFKGIPAMIWRQRAEAAEEKLRKTLLAEELTGWLPGTSEVELLNSPDWNATDRPLVAQFRVRVPVASGGNDQLSLAQHLFQAGQKPWFTAPMRSNAIDFHYPWQEADEVYVSLPAGVAVEKLAQDDSLSLPYALYRVQHRQEAGNKLYARRDFIMGAGLVLPDKYGDLKNFFDKVTADDAQTAVLRVSRK